MCGNDLPIASAAVKDLKYVASALGFGTLKISEVNNRISNYLGTNFSFIEVEDPNMEADYDFDEDIVDLADEDEVETIFNGS